MSDSTALSSDIQKLSVSSDTQGAGSTPTASLTPTGDHGKDSPAAAAASSSSSAENDPASSTRTIKSASEASQAPQDSYNNNKSPPPPAPVNLTNPPISSPLRQGLSALPPGSPLSQASHAHSDDIAELRMVNDYDDNQSGDTDDDGDGDDDDDDDLIDLETRPGTPVPGMGSVGGVKNSLLAAALVKSSSERGRKRGESTIANATNPKDPLRTLPTPVLIRIFLGLDIRSLARCDRVCKRWRKSSTLNYVWFLHVRSLTLPKLQRDKETGKLTESLETNALGNTIIDSTGVPRSRDRGFEDPYDKPSFLSTVRTPMPSHQALATPQWSKKESKQVWRNELKALATRSARDYQEPVDALRVDVDALSSGYATPLGGEDPWGNGGSEGGGGSGTFTPPKSKKEMREHYKSLHGRKSRTKGMMSGTPRGARDKGGMGGETDEDKFSAPW